MFQKQKLAKKQRKLCEDDDNSSLDSSGGSEVDKLFAV